jgi:ribonuclease HI
MDKSEMIFSKHTPHDQKVEIYSTLPMKTVQHFNKYLGMPTHMGRSKRQIFDFIQDRIWKKLKGWKEKHLSFAGRNTLIKAVAQAIPTYIMSCFLLPKNLCQHIESMTCKFWWGNSPDKKKIHWIKWKQICKNKRDGGLGFRGIRAFNQALLAKQGWQCFTRPDALLSRVLKAKYYPNCDFLKAKECQNMSYTWRSILNSSWILKKGGIWKIGDGETIDIWKDNWLPEQEGHKTWSLEPSGNPYKHVKDLILPISKTWNSNIISSLFQPFEAQQILNLPITNTSYPDEFYWPNNKEGIYTVKSGYQAILEWQSRDNDPTTSNPKEDSHIWDKLWKQQIPPKHKHLMWRVFHNALPVRGNLITRGIQCSPLCPRCNSKIESIDHIFKDCEWSRRVWFASQLSINFNYQSNKNFRDWLHEMFAKAKSETIETISSLCYHIWKARNMLVFQQKDAPVTLIIEHANSNLADYKKHLNKGPQRTSTNNPNRRNELNWTPPPTNTLKINVDAHCNGDGRWGLGWIVRGMDGYCLGAATCVVKARTATEAEARGLEAVLRSIQRFAENTIIIEMDSSLVVKAVQTKVYPRVYWGSIARNGGDLLSKFPNVSVIWGRRTGNKVVHCLARWAFSAPNDSWLTHVPPHVVSHIQTDMGFPVSNPI